MLKAGLLAALISLANSTQNIPSFTAQPTAIAPVSDAITIPLNDWSSQRVLSIAIGGVIAEQGYSVNYQEIAAADQWGALRKGIIHFQLEVWQQTMAAAIQPFFDRGYIVDFGSHQAMSKEGWWYPDYLEQLCPGLPNWRALKHCSEQLLSKPPNTKEIYFTGPWQFTNTDIARALELDVTITRLKDESAIHQLLNSYINHKKPIVLLSWSPNWIDTKIRGKFLESPSERAECNGNTDSDKINEHLFECSNSKKGWIKKVAWPKFQEKYPCVAQFVKNINLTQAMISEASAYVMAEQLTEQQAAQRWRANHQADIERWLPTQCFATSNTNN